MAHPRPSEEHQTPLPLADLCERICREFDQAEQAQEQAEQHYIACGRLLAELKLRKPEGQSWEVFVREKTNIGRSRADELIQLAEGRTTLAAIRQGYADRDTRRGRRSRVAAVDHGGTESEDPPSGEVNAFIKRIRAANKFAKTPGPITELTVNEASKTSLAWLRLVEKMIEAEPGAVNADMQKTLKTIDKLLRKLLPNERTAGPSTRPHRHRERLLA